MATGALYGRLYERQFKPLEKWHSAVVARPTQTALSCPADSAQHQAPARSPVPPDFYPYPFIDVFHLDYERVL